MLGVATGKSRRGVDHLFAEQGWATTFATIQTADGHPSKPHPSMILAALEETGVAAQDAVMIGDTSYDMAMARDAGVRAIGVGWGYHAREHLTAHGASQVVETYPDLMVVLASEDGWC
jgi:phosphoglycolate phosphatase